MQKIQLPPPVKKGATIGVMAPSSAAGRKATKRGLDYLKNLGYRVKTASHITYGTHYLAGNDTKRLRHLHNFITDPDIDALIFVRGGYGLLRILDRIDYRRLAQIPPKVIVGYSDITALQMALLSKLGWVTYSGPMVASDMGKDFSPYSAQWLWKMISQPDYPLRLSNPTDRPLQVFRSGEARGRLIGGCISLLTPLLDTPFMPALEGNILVLEDIGEMEYKLDRLFQILKLHGVFEKISGLIIGQLKNCFPKNPAKAFTLEELLTDTLGDSKFPVLTNFAYGHITRRLTLPWGLETALSTAPPEVILQGI